MIHPPDVVGKYAPDAIIGVVGEGTAAAPAASGGAAAPAASGGGKGAAAGSKTRNYEKSENNRKARMKKEGRIGGWGGALIYMAIGFMKEIFLNIFLGEHLKTDDLKRLEEKKKDNRAKGISDPFEVSKTNTLSLFGYHFGQTNFIFTNDRSGLTRSAMWLFVFIIIHAIGNLHVFLGPNDFNGYGYFYVRLYWTGFGLPANIVEIYVALGALLHILVALKRTWDMKLTATPKSGGLNLIVSGICLLTFMTIHLFQFRFGETRAYKLCPPPYLINAQGIVDMNHFLSLFWMDDSYCNDAKKMVEVRDIYRLEFELFESLGWSLFYTASVVIFGTHMCLGWKKAIPSPQLDIPKRYHNKATHIGYIMTAIICVVYVSFPLYAHVFALKNGCSPTTTLGSDNFVWKNCSYTK